MKTSTLFFVIALLLGSVSLQAQTPPPVFCIVETMKTLPGKSDEYVKAEREVWKKLHQERVKRGLIRGWDLYTVRYPSGTNAAYDYVTVTYIEGPAKLENPWGVVFDDVQKLLSKDEIAVGGKTGLLRNLTTTSLYYQSDFATANPKATTPPKYIMVNMMKVKPGTEGAYEAMETKLVKPVLVAMMKAGGRAGWVRYSLVLPGGSNQPFNFVTADAYDKWADIGQGDAAAAIKKVHPGMTLAAYGKQIEATRQLVNQELWELLDSAR
jgi:L-rhamnose mutarotase